METIRESRLDKILFWILVVSALVGWAGLIFTLLLLMISIAISIPWLQTVLLVISLPEEVSILLFLMASVAAFVIWVARRVKQRRAEMLVARRLVSIRNETFRVLVIVGLVMTFLAFLPMISWVPGRLSSDAKLFFYKIQGSRMPYGSAGIVKLTVLSVKRAGKDNYKIEITVENKEPSTEPDAEMYLGGEGAFDLEGLGGLPVSYSSLKVDYHGHEDYISPGEVAEFTLLFKDVEGKPSKLVYNGDFYTDDKSIRVDFSSLMEKKDKD